jgi:hypothetical protein
MNPWLIICSLDLSKVYDFKFCIFVHPDFLKDTFGLNHMSKDALFDFNFFQNILDFFKDYNNK